MLIKGELAIQMHAAEQTIEIDGVEQCLYLADSWMVMDDVVPFKASGVFCPLHAIVT